MSVDRFAAVLLTAGVVFIASNVVAADDNGVVPDHEKSIAQSLSAEGPTETHGIKASEILGSVGLGDDFATMHGRSLRARRVTLSPGGVVGVHQHDARPGVLYMLEGELTEVRNDADNELTRVKGDTSFEKDGVVHWWRNDNEKDAIALVVDIVPDDQT